MVRKIEKVIPRNISFLLIFCYITDLIAYYGGKVLSQFFSVDIWQLPIDSYFGIIPEWAWIYMGAYILWVTNYILICRNSYNSALRLVSADFLCKAVSMLFFVFLPTTIVRPSLDSFGSRAFLLRLIYMLDSPIDLFPSFHCVFSWLCVRPLFDCKNINPCYKVVSFVLCILVFLSTLYTKQHVFADVIGGIVFAELSYDIVKFTKLMDVLNRVNIRFVRFVSAIMKDDSYNEWCSKHTK